MTIKKFSGKTKEEAIAQAKEALGEHIVIMNTRDKKPEGVFGIFKKGIWEVTVAVEDEEISQSPVTRPQAAELPTSTFTALADDPIDIMAGIKSPDIPLVPKAGGDAYQQIPEREQAPARPMRRYEPKTSPQPQMPDEDELKSVFKEVSRVIENAPQLEVSGASSGSNIIKKEDIVQKKTVEQTPAPPREEPAVQPQPQRQKTPRTKHFDENIPLIRMVYNILIGNEVDERYINEILDDMGNVFSGANSLDYLLSGIYQKMVLKLGKVSPIELPMKGPLVVFFVGPTGVGKTTTIAKIASDYRVNLGKKVAFITADTYRIAAAEQLSIYANLLSAPLNVIYEPADLNPAIAEFKDYDLILVDTLGFSHKNEEQKNATRDLIGAIDPKYQSQVYLVASVTTKYQDLKDIADAYKSIADYRLIFTKLDETDHYGNILNIKLYTGAELSYITNGQNVPDDIDIVNSQKLVKSLLKGQ